MILIPLLVTLIILLAITCICSIKKLRSCKKKCEKLKIKSFSNEYAVSLYRFFPKVVANDLVNESCDFIKILRKDPFVSKYKPIDIYCKNDDFYLVFRFAKDYIPSQENMYTTHAYVDIIVILTFHWDGLTSEYKIKMART